MISYGVMGSAKPGYLLSASKSLSRASVLADALLHSVLRHMTECRLRGRNQFGRLWLQAMHSVD